MSRSVRSNAVAIAVLAIVLVGGVGHAQIVMAQPQDYTQCSVLMEEIKLSYVSSHMRQIGKAGDFVTGERPTASFWRWVDLYMQSGCEASEIAVTLADVRNQLEEILARHIH